MPDERPKLDGSITTVSQFKHAIKDVFGGAQMFVQLTGHGDDDSALVEITEVFLNLPKYKEEEPYVVLRCK